jgi:hypothetical protein
MDRARHERMNSNNVDARDAKFNLIYSELIEEASMKNHLYLQHEVTHRMRIDHIFKELYPEYASSTEPSATNFTCYKDLVSSYHRICSVPSGEGGDLGLPLDEYTLSYFKYFWAVCQGSDLDLDLQKEHKRMQVICNH